MGAGQSFVARLRRGHLFSRLWRRAIREGQSLITTCVLTFTKPQQGAVAIVTLNADEENATVQAVLTEQSPDLIFVSPDQDISRTAVGLAARRLERNIPDNINYHKLSYPQLLKAYRRSETTYSTHVLLPGSDLSRRRRHVHLTHGSGPKPDTTFRSPANVLASITPQWVPAQLREYKLPANTEVIEYMPRLEVMRRAIGDRSVLTRLGLAPNHSLIIWAPTFRTIYRNNELRVSGIPISPEQLDMSGRDLQAVISEAGTTSPCLFVKAHPHEATKYAWPDLPVLTNATLREASITPYELFGAADLVVTDYSSIYMERRYLGLPFALFRPDASAFASSDRGFRE